MTQRIFPRNIFIPVCGLLFLLLFSLPASARETPSGLTYMQGTKQTTVYGQVEGKIQGQALVWLGVPYAAPPVEALRWKAPQKPTRYEGPRNATIAAERSLQIIGGKPVGSEDCLYLNIARPNSRATNLPVLVFLHGGNNQLGSSTSMLGENFAPQTDTVVVSVGYRLGALGWLNVPALKTGNPAEDSGNFGLLDMIAALDWVKENIQAFGGDPGNVILSGHSAGGRDTLALMISPLAAGKFHKAVPFSGGMTTVPPQMGTEIAYKAIAKWLVEDKLQKSEKAALDWLNKNSAEAGVYLRKQSATRISSIMTGVVIRMSVFPHLFADGHVLPKEGFAAFEAGNYTKVPFLAASDATEFSWFALGDPAFAKEAKEKTLLGGSKAKAFLFANKYGSMLYSSSNADRIAEKLVKHQSGVYACRYAWGTNPEVFGQYSANTIGATHGVHMPFLTGKLTSGMTAYVPDMFREENLPGFWQLQKDSNAYLRNFMHTGNPNGVGLPEWTTWTNEPGKNKIMIFDATKEKAVIGMSSEYITEEGVFTAMKADKTVSETERKLAYQVLSGRFFAKKFDQTFMTK